MDQQTDPALVIVESLQDVVFATDADGRLTYLNPAWTALTGHPVETSLGTVLTDYLEDVPLQDATRCITAYGGIRWVEVRCRRMDDGSCSGTIADVTERQRRGARLAEAEARF